MGVVACKLFTGIKGLAKRISVYYTGLLFATILRLLGVTEYEKIGPGVFWSQPFLLTLTHI